MKVLLTGFEPFGEHSINPSQLLVDSLPDQYQDLFLTKCILPVDHHQAPPMLFDAIHNHQPDTVISFGLAAGRAKITLERIAVNLLDFNIEDNSGTKIVNQPIVEQGPAAYFSSLPIHGMLAGLNQGGIPAELSLSAGAFLCNQVFYLLMHQVKSLNKPAQAGFIHLPALPEQASASNQPTPSMSIEHMKKAAYLILEKLNRI